MDFQADIASIGRIHAVRTILEVVCRTTGMGFAAVARVTEDRWIACEVRDEIAFGLKTGGELPVKTTICDEIRASGEGVVIERRGTKVGHVYQLLGHALGGDITIEPYLITLKEDAVPYTGFRHAGTELIYMLSGKVVYRHGDQTYALEPGDALMFDSAALHGPEILVERPATYLSIIVYRANPA